MASAGYYDQNRQDMLDHLQGKSNVYKAKKGGAAGGRRRDPPAAPMAPVVRRCTSPPQLDAEHLPPEGTADRLRAAVTTSRSTAWLTAMGVPKPTLPARWLEMLCAVAEQLPHAMAVTDMKTPGLPMTYCNSAMVKLTGYPKEHTQGRNCRFLQGKKTEAAAVRVMVAAIRSAKPTTVRVTNYRRTARSL